MARNKKRTFLHVIANIAEKHGYENEYLLDYFTGVEWLEPLQYDDYYAIVKYWSSEGIYADFYVVREADGGKMHIATAKTLNESEQSYIRMHELAAKVSLELRKLMN